MTNKQRPPRRLELWRQVHAAVRAGDLEAGRAALRALGWTKQATADKVLERIHKHTTTKEVTR